MNVSLISLEIAVVLLGLGWLLLDLFTPAERKRTLGYAAVAGLLLILVVSFQWDTPPARHAFGQSYVLDGLALFFKRFFLVAAALVLVLAVEFGDRLGAGISEYYALVLFALAGMMFAASANDFILLFVSLELITVTFYILTGFQRGLARSLEAGVKYLILGALASAFLVYGIALVYGASGTLSFGELAGKLKASPELARAPILSMGLLMVLAGLGFKIAAVPCQLWVPDVYQGSPTPTTAFLAVGSKAAGFALLLRVLFTAAPQVSLGWDKLLMVLAALTILYGNLCAIPQRNLKRLLGYSSIAHAGYLLLGMAALSAAGIAAILYYLAGYLFTVVAAFTVIALVVRQGDDEDVSVLAGLNQRSPFLALTMTVAMVSLAGVPPLAGFFGKFLLLKAIIERGGSSNPAYYWLAAAALVGIVISLWYYFGVIRAIFWSQEAPHKTAIETSWVIRASLGFCLAGMLFLGLYPDPVLQWAIQAANILNWGLPSP